MPYTSPEILMLEAVEAWLETLSVWTAWAGAGRIVWPLQSEPTFPLCVLGLHAGRTINLTGAAGGANFQPSGSLLMWVYDEDTAPTDVQEGYTVFADQFFNLIADMADNAHTAPLFLNSFVTPDAPIIRSSWLDTDDDDDGLPDYWMGQVTLKWGVTA